MDYIHLISAFVSRPVNSKLIGPFTGLMFKGELETPPSLCTKKDIINLDSFYMFSGRKYSREDTDGEFVLRPSLATTTEVLKNFLGLSTCGGENLSLYMCLIDQNPENVRVRNLVYAM
jgi:hypothetical protein